MNLKVLNGTPTGPNLCATCRNAVRLRTERGEYRAYCKMIGGELMHVVLREPVVECSGYDDERLPPIWEMKKAALYLTFDKKTNKAGFVSRERLMQLMEEGKVAGSPDDV